jgi:hypothetical protein
MVADDQESKWTVVADVVPQGKGFRIQFDEKQLSKTYPQYTAEQANSRQSRPVRIEEFKELVQKEALSKLGTLFPDGVPEGATSRIHIEIRLKFRPLEITIIIEIP